MKNELKKYAHVSGVRQTLRAVQRGEARRVFIARDASAALVAPLRELCAERSVPVEECGSMRELGALCALDVGAAAAAVIG